MQHDEILTEMKAYYDARANEYDEWFERRGRYDRGLELNAQWHAEVAAVQDVLRLFQLKGQLLELACGTGNWTRIVLENAESLVAVDASSRMLEINRCKIADPRVDYMCADIFQRGPMFTYDGAFFGFWLSHVPAERLDEFLGRLSEALKSGAKIFFVDSLPDPAMSAPEHKLPEPGSEIMTRYLNDGRSFRIVKTFHDADKLIERFAAHEMEITMHQTAHYFMYGQGRRL